MYGRSDSNVVKMYSCHSVLTYKFTIVMCRIWLKKERSRKLVLGQPSTNKTLSVVPVEGKIILKGPVPACQIVVVENLRHVSQRVEEIMMKV